MGKRFHSKTPEKSKKEKDDTLRSENRRLRKQVAQLQKQLARIQNREEDIREIVEQYEQSLQHEETPQKQQCPLCASYDIVVLDKLMNNTDYFSCNTCSGRGKLK